MYPLLFTVCSALIHFSSSVMGFVGYDYKKDRAQNGTDDEISDSQSGDLEEAA